MPSSPYAVVDAVRQRVKAFESSEIPSLSE